MKENNITRPAGMSLLDYLWANYSDFSVSDTPVNSEHVILTSRAVLSIIDNFKTIKLIQVVEKDGITYLAIIDSNDTTTTLIIPSGVTIKDFGKRQINLSDRNKGCELSLNSWVYYIVLSNGNEYLAPIDMYIGLESQSIITNIVNNSVYAELKINNRNNIISINTTDYGVEANLQIDNSGGINFIDTLNGLLGEVVLLNSDKFIRFSLLTLAEYEQLLNTNNVDDTTMYFIKGAKFFYFGKNLMLGSSESIELDNYYTKDDIDNKLLDYVKHSDLDDLIINWNDI